MNHKLSILIAPLHYCPNPQDGSEYTRAYDYLTALSEYKNVSGDVLVAYMQENKIGNLNIHAMLGSKPQYISILLRLRFIFWVYVKGLLLLSKNHYDLLWHNGPFAIGETFNILLLSSARKVATVIGPIVAPHTFLAADEGRSMGRKSYSSDFFLKLTRIIDSVFYKFKSLSQNLSNHTLQRASLVVAKDHASLDLLSSLQLKKLTRLTIGSDTTSFLSKPRKLLKRNKYKVISVGYLVRRKDFVTVIAAFNHLVNILNYRQAELNIIGDGPELNNLEKLVKKYSLNEYVKFIGHVPKHIIGTYYKESDLFVSGSISESMPAMYLEAMASSLPMVIASNATSIELASDNFGGSVVPEKNAIRMAEAIYLLLTNSDLYNNYSSSNYSLYRSKYNFTKQISKLIKLLYKSSEAYKI